MDAVEFLKERIRMCNSYKDSCVGCELYKVSIESNTDCIRLLDYHFEDAVNAVEQWSQSHPQKTIMQDFFEKFPNAPKATNGEPMICPYNCGYGNFDCEQANGICYNCWSRPLED